eukprot:4657036-Pyramimonas_sp.AAC.1
MDVRFLMDWPWRGGSRAHRPSWRHVGSNVEPSSKQNHLGGEGGYPFPKGAACVEEDRQHPLDHLRPES